MMQTDVKSAHIEATGTRVSGRNRLKAYHCISGGTAGDVIFRDGGASGTIRLQFNIGTGTQPVSLLVPGEGILFSTSVYVDVTSIGSVMVFYG